MKKLSNISEELEYLKSHLTMSDKDKGITLAYDDRFTFTDWLNDNYSSLISFFPGMEEDDYYALVEKLDADKDNFDGYEETLASIPDVVFEQFLTEYNVPNDPYQSPFLTMEYRAIVEDEWLIHFTDDAYSISSEGFTKGVSDYEHLALTTHFTDEAKTGGFNFAFRLGDAERYGTGSYPPKYGKHAVLFRASGVLVNHYGDQEPQVIFEGATATDIVEINSGEYDGWFVGENEETGDPLFEDDSLETVAEWVIDNLDTYRSNLVVRGFKMGSKQLKHLKNAVHYLDSFCKTAQWSKSAQWDSKNFDGDVEHIDSDFSGFEENTENEDSEENEIDFTALGEAIGIDWDSVEFTAEDLDTGYQVELEHGTVNPMTNITDDDQEMTAKIVWAHLKEMADYYDKLAEMEGGAEEYSESVSQEEDVSTDGEDEF